MELQPGDRGYWFNTMSCTDRPVSIVRVLKTRYVVKTDAGHCYSPPKSMVSRKCTNLHDDPPGWSAETGVDRQTFREATS